MTERAGAAGPDPGRPATNISAETNRPAQDTATPDKREWFNRGAFGHAGQLCATHPRAADLDATALAVFLAMASFVALAPRYEGHRSFCFAPQGWIGRRARVRDRAVRMALARLVALGLIEHTGRRVTGRDGRAGPVIYRLSFLAEPLPRPASSAGLDEARPAPRADEEPALDAGEGPALDAGHKPRNPGSPRGPGGGETEEEDPAAGAAAPGGAAAAAGRPSTEGIAKIAKMAGCSIEHTERWAEMMLAGQEVRTTADRYLMGCVRKGNGPAGWTPPEGKPKRPAKGGQPKGQQAASGPTVAEEAASPPVYSEDVPYAELERAIARSRAGESAEKIAADLNVRPGWVTEWHQDADDNDALAAVRAGELTPEQAAERFPMSDVDLIREILAGDAREEAERAEEEAARVRAAEEVARQRAEQEAERARLAQIERDARQALNDGVPLWQVKAQYAVSPTDAAQWLAELLAERAAS